MRSIELRRKRAALIEKAGALLTRAHEDDQRNLTEEEQREFDGLHTEADELLVQIEREEKQEQRQRELGESLRERGENTGRDPEQVAATDAEERAAFNAWLRGGFADMTEEQRSQYQARVAAADPLLTREHPELRAQTVTTTAGGYLIPQGFSNELDQAMLAYGGMREAARVVTTASGNTLDWPTVNDTGNTGRLLGINTQATTTDVTYGQVQFGAYKYSSDAVLVPVELSQDSAFDMTGHVRDLLAERLGRITNSHFTTGTGTGQPNGVVTAATDSTYVYDISNGLSFTNMVNLEHSVDPAYRRMPGCGWMMHDDALALVKLVVDSNGRPIFRGAMDAAGQVDSILGYPVHVNQDMPTPTGTNKAFLFGDFGKYIIRVVRPMVLLRLVERYADYHQIGFLAFERADGDLIDAGTNPVKYMDTQA